jgi:hypothetical protein
MSRVSDLKAQQVKDLARAAKEDALEALLPPGFPKLFLYCHSDHASVRIGDDYQPTTTLEQALGLLASLGSPIEAEHRKSGTLSIKPYEAYTPKELDSLCLERVSSVGIESDNSSGMARLCLLAWFRIGPELCEVKIPFQVGSLVSAMPTLERDSRERLTGRVLWRGIGEDFRVNWWSPPGNYRSVYYWETFESFKLWCDLKAKERADHG